MQHKTQSGFSLIETLVAITILLVVIVGPLSITTTASRSSSFSSEQVTAFFLAQEGLELAQKSRDDLLVPYFPPANANPDPWADFTRTTNAGVYKNCYIKDLNGNTINNGAGCDLTINGDSTGTLTITNCGNAGACQLYLDTTTAHARTRYTHTSIGNTLTAFTRVITFEPVGADEVKITAKVTWRTGSIRQSQTVSTETRLFNMYGF